ncbi:hypothetical protein [uncultured Thiodictyon sp.]|uniref:hypothetical protein n=1 Tax=uncultured Thiodictyon sp. TaxID=1846217 RepID=UPI0025CDF5E2|nr:hypothetical protein [uncultured Thiodictyon sp.]
MSPTHRTQRPDPAAPRRRAATGGIAVAAVLLLTLAGCTQFAQRSQQLAEQAREITCLSQCRATKEHCDDDARWDYQQCQAGYSTAQRDYLWCNSSDQPQCGYPWWSCSENLYGYCTNRYRECRVKCRRPGG